MTLKTVFLLFAVIGAAAAAETIVVNTGSQLKTLIDESSLTNPLIVRIFSSSGNKKWVFLTDALEKVAKAFSFLPVKIAHVNVDVVSDALKSQGLKAKDLPTIRLFAGKGIKLTLKEELGSKVEEAATTIINWIYEEVKKLSLHSVGLKYKKPEPVPKQGKSQGTGVVELTESDFDAKVINVSPDTVVLVEFFAPWCGHCKALAPTYAQVAKAVHSDPETYGEKTLVASVDATVHQQLASRFGIQGFPTIKLFVGGKLRQDYSGPRDASSIQDFIKSNRPPKIVPSSLKQLTDFSSDLEDVCMKAPLCVLSFLPNLYDCDAKCRNGYLDLLREEATSESGTGYGRGWQFFWLEGGSSEEMIRLEEDLGVGPGVGYPNLVVVNGKKEKYAPFRGSFSKAGLKEFLKGIIYGGKGASPLYPLPQVQQLLQKLKDTGNDLIEEWDGKDAPPLEVEKDEL